MEKQKKIYYKEKPLLKGELAKYETLKKKVALESKAIYCMNGRGSVVHSPFPLSFLCEYMFLV